MKLKAFLLTVLLSPLAFAGPGTHEAVKIPKDFEAMKKLIGTWEGKSKMGEKEENIALTYELTSGGTAISEKLMAGTPHEMLTVYHKEKDSVGMTHFCAMGNQPHMNLKKATDKTFDFEVTKPVGISSLKESHMHSLLITMEDPNTLKQDWTNWTNGKPDQTMTLNFKRKK
jgi:hypothetical protein